MNHLPTYIRTFSLHKVRENCHFLDHPPTPMSLRNKKMALNKVSILPNVSLQSFNLYSLVSTYVRDNNLSLEMILLPTQTIVLYLISDCNILWRMFDETNRCFIWFANKSTEWFDCRKISYQNSPDALTHRL